MGDRSLVATIDDFVNPEKGEEARTDALNTLLIRVHSGGVALHQLVENMADYLPSKDEVIRGRATLLLSEIIARLPELKLDEGSLHFLSAFYADRLQDFPSISEVLKGILALLTNHTTTDEDVVAIIRSITAEVVDQGYMVSLSQAARMNLLQIYSIVLDKFEDAAKSLKADFVFSFVRVLDGERDPRNLVIGFQTFVKVVHSIPEFVRFSEELFEVVSVYFPVTFTPKPNDPYGITKEALVQSLRACFAASSELAQHVIPFLLDKESSTISETKLDALETLSLCAQSYGSLTISRYVEDIWPALRTEVLTSKEARVVDQALKTVSDLTKVLASDVVTITSGARVSSNLREFLEPLINQCLHELRSPDSKIAISCGKILQAAASASVRACVEILKDTFPILLRQFSLEQRPSHRQSLLDLVLNFVIASSQFSELTVEDHPLRPWRDQLFTTFTSTFVAQSVLSTAKFKITSITGLRGLLLADLLDANQTEVVLLHFSKAVLEDKDAVVRSNALRALDVVAHQPGKAGLVEKYTLPALLDAITSMTTQSDVATLPQPREESEEHREDSEGKTLPSILGALTVLASEASLCRVMVPRLLAITESHWAELREASQDGKPHSVPAHVLEALSRVVASAAESPAIIQEWAATHCPRVLKLLINEASSQTATTPDSADFLHALDSSVRLFGAVTRGLEAGTERAAFVDSVAALFLNGKADKFPHEVESFRPFDEKAPTGQKLLIRVFTAVVGSAHRDTPLASADEALGRLYAFTETRAIANAGEAAKAHELIALSASQGLAAVVNKLPEDSSELSEFLAQVLPELGRKVGPGSSAPFQEKTDALRTLTWLAKALVMRGHAKGKEVANELIGLLSSTEEEGHKKLSVLAAQSMDVIIGDSEDVLNVHTSSRIRVLYKQRFFSELLPTLLRGFHEASAPSKPAHLLAISYLLKHIPKSVLLSELHTVMPLIVQSINADDEGLIASTLQTLSMLIKEAPNMVSEHVSAFVPALLRLTTFRPKMAIRIAALDCLSSFITLPFYKIFPYQKKIANELSAALDDPKRAVRKAAVKCRNQWFGLKTDNTALRKPAAAPEPHRGHDHHGHDHDHAHGHGHSHAH